MWSRCLRSRPELVPRRVRSVKDAKRKIFQWSTRYNEVLRRRRPQSATRGRKATPAECDADVGVVEAHTELELWHARTWGSGRRGLSDVYANRRRKGARRQNAGSYWVRLGPEIIEKIHGRIVVIAQERSSKVRGYGWTRQSPKLIFIIRPIAACWAPAFVCWRGRWNGSSRSLRVRESGCGTGCAVSVIALWNCARQP